MSARYSIYKKVARIHPLPAFFSEYAVYAAQSLVERPSYVLASYPKSGRTWLHYMLVTYYAAKYGLSPQKRIISMARREPRMPSIILTHDGKVSAFWCRNKWPYAGRQVVFLCRDPRDAVVSHYHHCRDRDRVYDGELSGFLRDPYYGIDAVIGFLNDWWRARHQPKAFHLCCYEDFLGSTRSELLKLLAFLKEWEVDNQALDEAVASGSLESMRQREQSGAINLSGLTGPVQTEDARKVRKGKVGGYREELDADDIAYLDERVATQLDPAFGYR